MSSEARFPPYIVFRDGISAISQFATLTELSYGLALQLLFKNPRTELVRAERPSKPPTDVSYSMADRDVKSVDLVCGWVPVSEYASLEQSDPEEVGDLALRGELGPTEIHPDTKEVLLIWPPGCQTMPPEDRPQVGKSTYRISVETSMRSTVAVDPSDMAAFEDVQKEFLRLAHALGDPEHVAERAGEMANRATLLLYWTAFEVFLRSTIHELMRRHPRVLAAGKRAKETVTFAELAELSADFSSAQQLLGKLVEKEIESHESAGESVHGLINFLKTQFRFSKDPYVAWYVLHGEQCETNYAALKEVREVRNTLVHDGGRACDRFCTEYPTVPLRDGVIAVDDEFLLRSRLLLESIAHNVATIIEDGSYEVGTIGGP